MSAAKSVTRIAFVLCATLGAIFKITLYPEDPSPEPILVCEPFSDFENIAVGNLAESEQSREFQRNSFSAEQIVWMVIGGLCFSLISIPISLVYHRYLGDRHNETGTEQESSEIRMILQEGEKLILELKTMVALEKQAEGHREVQFLKEMDSMKIMNKEEEKRYAEIQNELDSMKGLMNVQGAQLAQFETAMDIAKNMMNMERRRCTKFWDDVSSMKKNLDKSLSIRKKQTGRQPAAKQLPAKVRAPKDTRTVVPTPAAKEIKAAGGSNEKQP
jgi:hypothetical protein